MERQRDIDGETRQNTWRDRQNRQRDIDGETERDVNEETDSIDGETEM